VSQGKGVKKRRTYWIVDLVTQRHRERALLLNQAGYDVHFFTTLDQFISEIQMRRAGIILVSDSGPENKIHDVVMSLISLPEISGARLLLIVDRAYPAILSLAAAGNFRDMIPFDMEESSWVNRIAFATAGRAIAFPKPVGQMTVNSIAALRVPARIVWVSPRRVWIESRIQAPVGSVLTIEGGFAKTLGLESISITVEENVRKNLMYRFSDATIASWNVPASSSAHAAEVLSKMTQQNTGPRCRVFIAAQNQRLRNNLMQIFDHPKFEIGAALQKQSLVHEPKYFNPHIVMVEDSIARDEAPVLDEMIAGLGSHAAVMIVGNYFGLESLRKKHPGRRIGVMKNLPHTLPEIILKRFAPLLSTTAEGIDTDAIFLLSEHEMSFAEISLPARLTGLHTMAGEVAAPVNIGNFALAQLDSPFLKRPVGRSPWVKFVTVRQETQPGAAHLTCAAGFFFADLRAADREKVADLMMETLRDNLGRFAQSNDRNLATGAAIRPDSRFPVPADGGYRPVKSTPASILPFNPPSPVQRDPGGSTFEISYPPPASASAAAAAMPSIRPEQKPDSSFVAQMRPIYAEADKRDEVETEVRVKRLTHGTRNMRRQQTIAFIVIVLTISALIWIVRMSSDENPANAGKVWSDSFKAFKDHEGSGRKKNGAD